ncbi:ATP-binding cassette domain-containing protein [Kibdelosporangium philippinense]|uniref:ATP-binding cassette domain-containing protein n=1 Tax=Kibdelosporangium philippinense TaxID=211113 RepID=A0ABS8ZID5_9PSEU|nr:ATP-binding cassette domain-containing protein [Kibdelosporangium philippinense]MCE7007149.1 ATP-binding cassette domain-containing protein [Kibdelosporangium philippinense]
MSIEIRGLRKSFGSKEVLAGVDLTVAAGEFVAVLGANGSGKSTVLRCAVGLQQPDAGTISIDGGAAMVFQQIHLVGRRTVLDNVCSGALGRLRLRQSVFFPRSVREEAMECLARVGLADRASDRASKLSGGQQQRVAIARALCQRAKVILADEPVSALDPSAAEQVVSLLASLADEGLAVLAVLHQPELAQRFADRIIGLTRGKVAFTNKATTIDSNMVNALYEVAR